MLEIDFVCIQCQNVEDNIVIYLSLYPPDKKALSYFLLTFSIANKIKSNPAFQ